MCLGGHRHPRLPARNFLSHRPHQEHLTIRGPVKTGYGISLSLTLLLPLATLALTAFAVASLVDD